MKAATLRRKLFRAVGGDKYDLTRGGVAAHADLFAEKVLVARAFPMCAVDGPCPALNAVPAGVLDGDAEGHAVPQKARVLKFLQHLVGEDIAFRRFEKCRVPRPEIYGEGDIPLYLSISTTSPMYMVWGASVL